MKNLYVGNMEATTTEQDLRTAFAVYGPVDVVSIITDRTTGLPRGFAFVEMAAEKDANEAVLALNGSLMARPARRPATPVHRLHHSPRKGRSSASGTVSSLVAVKAFRCPIRTRCF